MKAKVPKFERVYWFGAHKLFRDSRGKPVNTVLGKIHKPGLELLRNQGWRKVPSDDESVPEFAFTTRRGADFSAISSADLPQPRVRQLPQVCTNILDDKKLLSKALKCYKGVLGFPLTFSDLGECCLPEMLEDGRIYFLKHRHGVKGKAVYPLAPSSVLTQVKKLDNPQDFVLQEEVYPPLLDNGRKFTLRVHVLALQREAEEAVVYLYRDIIAVSHSGKYIPHKPDKGMHVSSHGKSQLSPSTLEHILGSNVDAVILSLKSIVKQVFEATCKQVFPQERDSWVTFCHLFGFDFILDTNKNAWLLEINSYPAFASGTMCKVDVKRYNRLLLDIVSIAVLRSSIEKTSFSECWSSNCK